MEKGSDLKGKEIEGGGRMTRSRERTGSVSSVSSVNKEIGTEKGKIVGAKARGGSVTGNRERVGSGSSTRSMDSYLKKCNEDEEKEMEKEVFGRSKLVERSPEREERFMEKIKGMMLELGEMKEKMTKMEGEVRQMESEQKEKEETWRREKEELVQEVELLKDKVKRLEEREGERGDGKVIETSWPRKEERKEEEKEIRILKKSMEKMREEGEREKRKKNVVVKGIETGGKAVREAVENLWRELEIEAKVVEVREIGRKQEGGKKMALVKLENMKGKMEVMRKKVALKGRTERIDDDWTWRERAIQWRLERMAWKERRNGRKALVRYGKIWMGEKWWMWDEDREELIDGEGEGRETEKVARQNRSVERTAEEGEERMEEEN